MKPKIKIEKSKLKIEEMSHVPSDVFLNTKTERHEVAIAAGKYRAAIIAAGKYHEVNITKG